MSGIAEGNIQVSDINFSLDCGTYMMVVLSNAPPPFSARACVCDL